MQPPDLLRAARRHAGLSQRALAAAAKVDPAVVARIESGTHDPSTQQLLGLVLSCGMRTVTAIEPLAPLPDDESHRSLSEHLARPPMIRLAAVLHAAAAAGRPIGLAPPEAVLRLVSMLSVRIPDVVVTGAVALALWTPQLGGRPGGTPIVLCPRPGSGMARVAEILAFEADSEVTAADLLSLAGERLPVRMATPSGLVEVRPADWALLHRGAAPVITDGEAPDHVGLRVATPVQLTWSDLHPLRAGTMHDALDEVGERAYRTGRRLGAHRDPDLIRRYKDSLWPLHMQREWQRQAEQRLERQRKETQLLEEQLREAQARRTSS